MLMDQLNFGMRQQVSVFSRDFSCAVLDFSSSVRGPITSDTLHNSQWKMQQEFKVEMAQSLMFELL